MEKLIILGIDPGTTKGYAVLDINGEILEVKSSKKLDMNQIIQETFKFGKPILVGTDVKKVPSFVSKISGSLGAKTIFPDLNLRIRNKQALLRRFLKNKDFEIKNKHERDALIAALIAYKSIKPLIKKIDDKYPRLNKEEIKNLVLKENINIKEAIRLLES